ncbi:GNAT family N-acetyltransferase [Bacillus pinisoli]|uniref:GNAT family N-acetyltransferase n=1 Tax=Bacillus pinisoli TaxID=2901866 RepID=UPI001FF50C76
MLNVEIRRPEIEDREQVKEFFRLVIIDTFNKEGIGEKLDDMKDEIKTKEAYLEDDYKSNGNRRNFLIAVDGRNDKIIGCIEFGPASNLIIECTNNNFKDLLEVGTVFVHPDYQGRGVGKLLLNKMFNTLQSQGIKECCLDSGYIQAQKVWKNKFGEPNYLLKDYWGIGYHHMIWKIGVSNCI